MIRRYWAALAFAVYVAAIVLSNYAIGHWGKLGHGGTHTTPVFWFGLTAPSGVWAAALTFPARDVVQRLGGRVWGLAAVLIGAGVAYLISDPFVALASGVTYLCSEGLDFAAYSAFQRRWYRTAVVVSVGLALLADSVLFITFLHAFTGTPADWSAVTGLITGKLWVALIAVPAVMTLRSTVPVAVKPQAVPA